ncbi:MAG: aminotransferase class IV [Phycisphaerae bacterium]|jgi:D-alanine transaminase
MQIAMINDRVIPYEQLEPAYLDRGLYFGDGVYEVLRSYNGKIFALDEHMNRFSHSLAAIGIETVDVNDIRDHVLDAFKKSEIRNARIYFHITRGSSSRSHSWPDDIKPNFFMTITQLEDSGKVKANGIAVSTYPDLRWKRCDIKSLNLLANVLAYQDAKKKGCDESILVNDAGFITEGSSSSFFAIINGSLRTTPLTSNILPSITRGYVLKAAQSIGVPFEEKSITTEQAKSADELFIAVTTKDIVPIVKFDDVSISDGRPGKITARLIEQFKQYT